MLIRKTGTIDVVEAAKIRIKNVFSNGLPVYLSFSGGKDSLVLGHLVYSLIKNGEIDPDRLTVHFIDEEVIYPCLIKRVMDWRKKFLSVGVKFLWFCLEVKHFNTLNQLSNDESFICWDRYKRDRWVREMPPFAITHHPLFRPRLETYQTFLERLEADGISISGVRLYESIQRMKNIARRRRVKKAYPIYDWRDKDVWLYIKEHNIDFPEAYMYLYQIGRPKSQLRLSQMFSIDTVGSLVSLFEIYPDFMQKVMDREPNAYLAALYWDSEMFRRSSTRKRKIERERGEVKDYRKLILDLLSDIDKNFPEKWQKKNARNVAKVMLMIDGFATQRNYKDLYSVLIAGDPKRRSLRAIIQQVYTDYNEKLFGRKKVE